MASIWRLPSPLLPSSVSSSYYRPVSIGLVSLELKSYSEPLHRPRLPVSFAHGANVPIILRDADLLPRSLRMHSKRFKDGRATEKLGYLVVGKPPAVTYQIEARREGRVIEPDDAHLVSEPVGRQTVVHGSVMLHDKISLPS